MKSLNDRIISFQPEDLIWDFEGKASFFAKLDSETYGRTLYVDPTPGYSHDRQLVLDTLTTVEEIFPIPLEIKYFILPFEEFSRTNGSASPEHSWDRDTEKSSMTGAIIVFSGKRIPPHPAMTRYLVSHERGHCVDYYISSRKGIKSDEFRKQYAEMRGLEYNKQYGPGKWHTNTGEILCNDARICLFGVEPEFWPHPCEHPLKLEKVQMFWYQMMLEML